MKNKYVKVPFDLERAKRIQEGKEEGRIINKKGQSCRLICFDRIGENKPIVILVLNTENWKGEKCEPYETGFFVDKHGCISDNPNFQLNLVLEVPQK